jgi:hypothetical protein
MMLATSTSTHARVRVRASDGASDPSLADQRTFKFYDTIARAWITQSGDMEICGRNERDRASRLSCPPSQPGAHAALVGYPFTTLARTSPHASYCTGVPYNFISEGKVGRASPSRVCASRQAQGRAARASKHRTSFQSPFIYNTRTSWPPTRLCTRQCLSPQTLEVIMPNEPANGVLRATDN